MNLNLNTEQIAYLKGLDSKEKRREFLLDCLVENVIGESEKIIFGNFDFLKDADSPRYLFPHEMEQIQRLNPSFTNTTAPRTFEQLQNKDELLKFDMLEDKKADALVDSLLEFHQMAVKCVLMKENPAPMLSNYLLLFQKLYFYKTKDKIEFIEKMFPQLKSNESANSKTVEK